jgi:hypothetical protein
MSTGELIGCLAIIINVFQSNGYIDWLFTLSKKIMRYAL